MVHKTIDLGKKLTKQYRGFIIYSIIGFCGLFVDIGSFLIMTKLFGINYLIANTISMSLGIVNNFILNVFFNFKTKDRLLTRFISFAAIGISGMFITNFILYIFVEKVGIDEAIVKILSLGVIVVYQYNMNRMISFREMKPKVVTND